tara:strand:+ start:39228 stop:40067 length:840 start_codon:yes stop_codon:yes gene_type:complete
MPDPKFNIPLHQRFRHAQKRPHLEALKTPEFAERVRPVFRDEDMKVFKRPADRPVNPFEIIPVDQLDRIMQAEHAEQERKEMLELVAIMQQPAMPKPKPKPNSTRPADDFDRITQGVHREYSSMFGTRKPERYADDARKQLAARTGCEAIGDESCYAVMVGVPKDMPDVVVKVCTDGDAFIKYANACYKGKLKGEHMLKVYSAAEVQPGVWVFVTERLWYKMEMDEFVSHRFHEYRMQQSDIHRAICEVQAATRCSTDLHPGNVMKRRDGTVVLLDPVC